MTSPGQHGEQQAETWWEHEGRVFVAPDDGGRFDLDNEEDVSELFTIVANTDATIRSMEQRLCLKAAEYDELKAVLAQVREALVTSDGVIDRAFTLIGHEDESGYNVLETEAAWMTVANDATRQLRQALALIDAAQGEKE